MIRRTVIASWAVAAVSLLAAAPAVATFPGANGRVAFTEVSGGGYGGGIATINPDGTDLRQLSATGSSPAWSADGRRIVYTDGDIHIMRADGSNNRQITFTPRAELNPSFSPGGGRIVYWQNGTRFSAYARVMTMRADGSDQRTLVREGLGSSPEWAPNGRHIAYIGSTPGEHGPGIWTMRPDGSHRREVYFAGGHGIFGSPHYAPDSRSIVFTQTDPEVIMKVGAFGNNPHEVNSGPINSAPQISPDGNCLVGVVLPYSESVRSDVYAKGIGSQCPTPGWLTNDRQPVHAYDLSWQPLPGG
jgi:Tol biopolymer transport system component